MSEGQAVSFTVSEERFQLIGQEVMMIGQQHKIPPYEFAVIIKMVADEMLEICGVDIKEIKHVEDKDEQT